MTVFQETWSSLRVRHLGNDRFTIAIGEHEIAVDQPKAAGGEGTAPTPTDLLIASLASCVAFYGRRFLKRHSLPEEISVEAFWEMGARPARVDSIRLSVAAPGLPASMRTRFTQVIDHCTVHNTLRASPQVEIALSVTERELTA